ncbi:oxygenase MpaB family protein [Microtetraspora sp. AC03309]|uniref:oxygenase MpaB family protein n=1 Tax=Microtetraspora sp. AC03309 TaxID=2779376 RepID=UPI001E4DD7F9|nr:oxygenase MpaB family protein [Microtetraspora sp. AC03309]
MIALLGYLPEADRGAGGRTGPGGFVLGAWWEAGMRGTGGTGGPDHGLGDGLDNGLFGPESVTWRVMGEPILLIGGFRALLLQGLHPRAMRGVTQNSALLDPAEAWARFQRTTDFVRVRTFGTTAEVAKAGARVRRIHATLTAFDPDRGERFRLDDPDALRWVHVGEVDSYLSVARRAGVPLSDADADRFVAEWRRAAEVVGLRGDDVPGSVAELRDYMEAQRPGLYFVPEASHPLLLSLNAPLPLRLAALKPAFPVIMMLAFASLPRWARRLYGLPATPLGDLWASATLKTLHRGLGLVPAQMRYSPSARRAREVMAAYGGVRT